MTYDLNTLWFILVGVLFTGYVVLDGFDLGVGALHLFTKTDTDRRLMLNAIGPVWDGNEVWLVTGGGALFGAFPHVYATAFSAFYMPFMLLLVSLIFRAVAIEFRSKSPSPRWRQFWDISFAAGSTLSAFLIGVAVANVVWGIPLDKDFEYTGNFVYFLSPYALWVGLTTVALFMMHGAIYIVLKTEGALQAQARKWVGRCMVFFLCTYLVFNVLSVALVPHVAYAMQTRPHIIGIMLLDILVVASLPYWVKKQKEACAFIASCVAIALLMLLFGTTMYPKMLVSYPGVANTLDIYNSASTPKTLGIMALMAAIGVPLVLTYTVCIYWVFRGKVALTKESY